MKTLAQVEVVSFNSSLKTFPSYVLTNSEIAKEAGKEMGGALLLLPPEKENHPAVAELSEALYLYDYPAAGEDEASNPGLVKVMAKPAFDKATSGNIVPVSWDGPEIAHLLKDALAQDDRTFSANWFQVASNTGGLETLAYMDGDQACGFICTRQAGLAGRVMALWVDPAKRNAGIGTALASRAFDGSASRQELVFTVWNLRKGTLRYFFDKLGFDDQITAMYFIREG